MTQLLRHRPDDLDVHRLGESRELIERVRRTPRLSRPFDRDQERLLRSGLGRGISWFAWLFRLERFVEVVDRIDIELVQLVEVCRLVRLMMSIGWWLDSNG